MRAGCRLRRASAVLDARFHLKASSISSAVQRLETPKRWRLVRRQSDGQALRRERRFARCPALTGGAADRWAGVGAGGGAWLASRVPPARAAARWPRTWLASKRAPEAGLDGRLPRAFDERSSARAGGPRPAPRPHAAMPSTTRFLGSPSTRPPRRRYGLTVGTNAATAPSRRVIATDSGVPCHGSRTLHGLTLVSGPGGPFRACCRRAQPDELNSSRTKELRMSCSVSPELDAHSTLNHRDFGWFKSQLVRNTSGA